MSDQATGESWAAHLRCWCLPTLRYMYCTWRAHLYDGTSIVRRGAKVAGQPSAATTVVAPQHQGKPDASYANDRQRQQAESCQQYDLVACLYVERDITALAVKGKG